MTQVNLRKGESVERALKILKRKLMREGLTEEMRKRRFYEKPSRKKYLQRKKAKFSAKLEARENARWQ